MNPALLISIALGYTLFLFLIAEFAEKRSRKGVSLTNNPYVYALSLAVYCTAWTFFGSIGKASQSGISFLPIYIGPTLCCILWWFVLRKMIIISKTQRITSIADFASARYGKSITLGIIATMVCIVAIIPYIAIQLKAVAVSYNLLISNSADLHQSPIQDVAFYRDSAWYIAIIMAIFTILFGTRRLDPIERHEGMVVAIAFESLFKLLAFLLGGLFVAYVLFNGLGQMQTQALAQSELEAILSLEQNALEGYSWFCLCLLSALAILLLPRQFHIAVVENTNPDFVKQASWIFPLYLFMINLFVLPVALGGKLLLDEAANPDTYILSLPLFYQYDFLAIIIALGGFSAAISMVVVAVTALSIMISNSLMTPLLLRSNTIKDESIDDLSARLLNIRRVSVVIVLIVAYSYFKFVSAKYALVSIGLISFAGIAQFAPAILGGMYWKGATRRGAIAGISIGFLVWAFCLPLPTLAETGLIDPRLLTEGLGGIQLLRPYQLFGMEGWDTISHGTFWSLLLNTLAFVGVSIFTRQSATEIIQADLFVDIWKYQKGKKDFDIIRRKAKVSELLVLLNRFLGIERARQIIRNHQQEYGIDVSKQLEADESFIHRAETHLAGAIGTASARVVIRSVVQEEPIQLREMFQILEQTQEIIQYSKALEQKSAQLEATTKQLQQANEQLKELDRLKADFITTVTHELRTPITSIKALSTILHTQADLPGEQKQHFLRIMVEECERIARLINQVLDLEKIQASPPLAAFEPLDFAEIVHRSYQKVQHLIEKQNIEVHFQIEEGSYPIMGNADKLIQANLNLLSNAIKFCDGKKGIIHIQLSQKEKAAILQVRDNGKGISDQDQKNIFEKFAQVTDHQMGKPKGTGLGLPITREIIRQHGGSIWVESQIGAGSTFFISLPLFEG